MLNNLPVEIIEHIGLYATPDVCFALMTTCHYLGAVAERSLYREIVLHDGVILSFIRSLVNSSDHDRRIRCNLIRKLTIRNTRTYMMAKANPRLCALFRLMHRIKSLSLACEGHSGDILFMFLSRAGLIRRYKTSEIPTLVAVQDRSPDTALALQELRDLEVSGNHLLLKLLHGRLVKSIRCTTIMGITGVTAARNIWSIQSGKSACNTLRTLSIPVFIANSDDLVRLLWTFYEINPNLEELDLRVFSVGGHVSDGFCSRQDICMLIRLRMSANQGCRSWLDNPDP